MDVNEALYAVENLGPDLLPDAAAVLAAEVRRLCNDRNNAREFVEVAARSGLIKPGTYAVLVGHLGDPPGGATGRGA